MKAAIQPKLNEVEATCACGTTYKILSTLEDLRLEICAGCHPFFTGTQRFVDTEGRIDKFRTKFGMDASSALKARSKLKKQKQKGPEGPPAKPSAAPKAEKV